MASGGRAWLQIVRVDIWSLSVEYCEKNKLPGPGSSRHPSILSDNGKRHGSGHVVLSPVKARLEWPLQGASLGKGIWRPCAAHTTRTPLSASLTGSKGMQGNTLGISLAAGVAGRKPPLTSCHLRDSTPDLYSGFTCIAFSMNGYNRKAAEYRYLTHRWGP